MIKKRKCVRCNAELDIFGFYKDAVVFEDELLAEGIDVECGDDLCDECANELVEIEQVETGAVSCIKCGSHGTLKSPGGSVYCDQCGHCKRNVYGVMKGVVVLRGQCRTSVEKFVWHERLGIWCCSCILKFEEEQVRKEMKKSLENRRVS